MVTGTRILRDGYEAPTPLTVIGEEQIQAAAPENIADLVNKLPSVAGSVTPLNSNLSFSNGQAGLNSLSLRNLGGNRTLVLLDGQRSVGSTITGLVDVNDFPQQLISRVDVVTGGASAAYGSDALSGVVNFVLDKKYTGLKGEVDGGVTTYGDDRNWKVTMTGGAGFNSDRGHFLVSGEVGNKDGIFGVPRAWNNNGWLIMTNPAYGTGTGQSTSVPQRLVVSGAGLSQATPGGIITTAGLLKGIYFGPGGTPYQFNYGTPEGDPFMVGGDWRATQVNQYNTLDQKVARQGLFTRLSYDVSDDLNLFFQAQWAHTDGIGWALKQFNVNNIVVNGDNAFIPANVAAVITANKITQFTLGSMNLDQPTIAFHNLRTVNRYVVGGNGKFDAFDSAWTWDAYYQKGLSRTSENGLNVTAKTNFAFAIDAVRGPNGQIICRSTVAQGQGCVPYDIMGIGVNSQAALNYIFGSGFHPQRDQRFLEDVEAASVHGEPFSDWAGPISLALGVEHRREAVSGIADPISIANGWFAGNYLPTFGSYTVTEGFAETVIPLAKDTVWAKSFDLNAAVRGTSYSTSGYVTTWKVGATWAPIDDIRFRATRSRDIRAPNLNDLYQAGTANTNNVTDSFNGNAVTTYQGLAVGNTALTPEVADTTGFGVVAQPSFFPGFSASFDYYNIDIASGIVFIGAQTIVDRCFQGQTAYCAAIFRGVGSGGGNVITQIRLQPFNAANQTARGYDIETSYHVRLDDISSNWAGNLELRFLATHYLRNYTNDGINVPNDSIGQNSGNGPPHWIYRGTMTYVNDSVTVVMTGRGLSNGVYGAGGYPYIACTSGCPVSTTVAPTINSNFISGAFYVDMTFSYKFTTKAAFGYDVGAFLNITNIANKDPVVVASGPGGLPYASPPDNPTFYDVLGRVFRVGVRLKI